MERQKYHHKTNCFSLIVSVCLMAQAMLRILAVCLLFASGGLAATGTVNFNTAYQQIEGFGAAGAYDAEPLTLHPQREALYDLMFRDLGLDVYRIKNTYTFDSTNITATGTIVGEAKERNPALKIELVPWSAPPNLKSNGSVNAGTLAGGPSSYVYADYADWWADSLSAWAAEGVVPDYISIQNEPDIETSYESCKFRPVQDSSFAGYDQAFEAVYQEIYSRMGSSMPKMIGPETTGYNNGAYGDPARGARDYIDNLIDEDHCYAFSFHLYSDGDTAAYDNPDLHLAGMESFAAGYGYKPLIMSEYVRLNETPDFGDAVNLAWHIHNTLYHMGVTSYYHWTLFRSYGTGGMINIAGGGYTIRDLYWFFKHYAYFTDPNWYVLDVTTNPSNNLRMSALKSDADDKLTVVLLNKSGGSESLLLDLNGCGVAGSQVYRSRQYDDHWAYIGEFSNPITLPARSITTIAFDAAGEGQVVPGVEILGSWVSGLTHAKEAGNRRALVFTAHSEKNSSTPMDLISVTYGGQAMTKVVEQNSGASSKVYAAAFILDEAGIEAATSNTFVPAWNITPGQVVYASAFLADVNQAALTGATAANATPSGYTITTAPVATQNGDMIIEAATCSNPGSYTTGNGFTEAIELSISYADAVTGYKAATGISETPGVTHSTGSGRQALIAIVVRPASLKASTPTPQNEATEQPVNVVLSWAPGKGATSHDVYFGTSNPPPFVLNQTDTNYDPGILHSGDYYWRIDERNADGTVTGDVWTFSTISPSRAWWQFEETSGTTAYDSVCDDPGYFGGCSDAYFNGDDPCRVSGKFNNAVDFNGVSDYFVVPSLSRSEGWPFTAAGWFKATQSAGTGTIMGDWAQYEKVGYGTYYDGWQAAVENNKLIARFARSDQIPTDLISSADVNDGQWHHLAVVWDIGSGPYFVAYLYLDGELQATLPNVFQGIMDQTQFRLGDGSYINEYENQGSPVMKGGPFNGVIDDLMLFTEALTEEQIQQLYQAGQ